MLIGYDPMGEIKFINTDTRYMERMESILGRPMEVSDFWKCTHELTSLHVSSTSLPDIGHLNRYRVVDGEIVPANV